MKSVTVRDGIEVEFYINYIIENVCYWLIVVGWSGRSKSDCSHLKLILLFLAQY